MPRSPTLATFRSKTDVGRRGGVEQMSLSPDGLVRPRIVTGDGAGLVSHAGLEWPAETADLAGLTGGLSVAMAG